MSEQVKAALILSVAILAATWLWIYFTPFETCKRALRSAAGADSNQAHIELICLQRFDNQP